MRVGMARQKMHLVGQKKLKILQAHQLLRPRQPQEQALRLTVWLLHQCSLLLWTGEFHCTLNFLYYRRMVLSNKTDRFW